MSTVSIVFFVADIMCPQLINDPTTEASWPATNTTATALGVCAYVTRGVSSCLRIVLLTPPS